MLLLNVLKIPLKHVSIGFIIFSCIINNNHTKTLNDLIISNLGHTKNSNYKL